MTQDIDVDVGEVLVVGLLVVDSVELAQRRRLV